MFFDYIYQCFCDIEMIQYTGKMTIHYIKRNIIAMRKVRVM